MDLSPMDLAAKMMRWHQPRPETDWAAPTLVVLALSHYHPWPEINWEALVSPSCCHPQSETVREALGSLPFWAFEAL